MDQSTGSTRQAAAIARRLIQRMLVVVGGAAAATALAWWLSSTSASADTAFPQSPQLPEAPAVEELAAPVADTLHTITDPLDASLRDFGNQFGQAADELGDKAEQSWNQLPNCRCDLDSLTPDAGGGRSDSPAAPGAHLPSTGLPVGLPVVLGPVADAGVDADALAERSAVDRAYSDGMPRRGSPVPGAPAWPGFPNWPAPVTPAAPTTGHSGQTGNSVDATHFVALPWSEQVRQSTGGQVLAATEAPPLRRPGAQPGVTPD